MLNMPWNEETVSFFFFFQQETGKEKKKTLNRKTNSEGETLSNVKIIYP